MKPVEYKTPESQGIPSEAIRKFVEEAENTLHELHSFMLLRHGNLVAQGWWAPYERDDPHLMFSLSKSFASTAIGFAVGEGILSLDTPVTSFFPEEGPFEPNDNLAAMQLQHLLSMTSGHGEDTIQKLYNTPGLTWVKTFLSLPLDFRPGTHFVYNTGASYMLSAILQKVTGLTLLEYLRPRLFEPLGIEPHSWENSPQGINTGGMGLSLKTAGIAYLGQLYLQKGIWNEKTLLSEEWIKAATTPQIETPAELNPDWQEGYGYQFWRCRNGAYRGDGAFGQFCLVMPEQDAVLAITAGLEEMQPVLNLVWKHLLGAMEAQPLPENPPEQQLLEQKLQSLEIVAIKNKTEVSKTIAPQVSGKRFIFSENDQRINALSFEFNENSDTLTIENILGSSQVECGNNGEWRKSVTTLDGFGPREVAASGGWVDEGIYIVKIYFLTPVLTQIPPLHSSIVTPFGLALTIVFNEEGVIVNSIASQSFLPRERTPLYGRLENASNIE